MRIWRAYAVISTITIALFGFSYVSQAHRIAALEQQLAAVSHAPIAAAAASKPSRTFTSTSGYVLTAKDLDRIDADHTAEKAAAELEYYVKQSDRRR